MQAVASQMLATQARLLQHRPDVQWFADQEASSLTSAERLVVGQRARPSLLLGALRAGGAALGLAAAVAPKHLQAAIAGLSPPPPGNSTTLLTCHVGSWAKRDPCGC
jgi:demethoxyubiquinone hydroxylase (CLK1/Coq7/Cat5 family)